LFVPKIPSYNILDVAEAIAPNLEIKEVGIRPGEKLHEEMITATDSINTVEFDDYFVILPSTKLWDIEKFKDESYGKPGKFSDFGFAYNSGNNDQFLSIDELRKLIVDNVDGAKEIIYGD